MSAWLRNGGIGAGLEQNNALAGLRSPLGAVLEAIAAQHEVVWSPEGSPNLRRACGEIRQRPGPQYKESRGYIALRGMEIHENRKEHSQT